MVVAAEDDPLPHSVPNSIQLFKNAFLPIESKFRFEHCFNGFVKDPILHEFQQDHCCKNADYESSTRPVDKFDHFRALGSNLGILKFARVRGLPSSIVGVASAKDVEDQRNISRIETHAGSVLKSALAGGLSCALSATLMHPVDTYKTWVQASTVTSPEIISKISQIGVRGLYKGSIPAIVGQFASHGMRTGICEASKFVLVNIAPTLSEIQVHSVASFSSTFIGTVMRIPCEVLKQRLQAGLFDNVGEAITGTWLLEGSKGFFRGTGATLCREIPFYVAGAGLYSQSKKVARKLLERELDPLEAIVIGALSGGITAVMTTPLDVIKTRMMIAPQGQKVTFSILALSILQNEGPLGLFKGAVPRFFWVAPLGAMNFAGYELIRKAMG
ncbi:hypothetical protein ABFX02_06G175300 [Erythranthe guttata]